MKKTLLFVSLSALMLSSCVSYNHSNRISDIPENALGQADKLVVDVTVDLNKQVKARSNTHASAKDAKNEAYFLAINDNNCHVVVDPIYTVQTTKTLFGSKSMAEIIGFAGYYKNARPESEAEQVAFDRSLDNTKKMMDKGIDTSAVKAFLMIKGDADDSVDDAGAEGKKSKSSGAGGKLMGIFKK